MDDQNAIDYRTLLMSPSRREKKVDLEPALEAFSFAWRPAGSMSLADRWLHAGEAEEPRRAPLPPLSPPGLKLKKKKLRR